MEIASASTVRGFSEDPGREVSEFQVRFISVKHAGKVLIKPLLLRTHQTNRRDGENRNGTSLVRH